MIELKRLDLTQAEFGKIEDNFCISSAQGILASTFSTLSTMPTDALFSAAPSFDQPLAVLKHCHDRIRKQLATLDKLLPHLDAHGADQQAQQAAQAVLRYFTQAAPLHHEDEEKDLLPSLVQSVSNADRPVFEDTLRTILGQHKQMEALWQQLEVQLQAISEASSAQLDSTLIEEFKNIYNEHMQIEETQIAPLAARTLDANQFANIGRAMQHRRGIN